MSNERRLDYETPPSDPQHFTVGVGCVGGVFLGAVAVLLSGGVIAATVTGAMVRGYKIVSVCFFAVALASLVGGVYFLGFGRRQRSAFLAGLLIGIAVLSLVEGACFTANWK